MSVFSIIITAGGIGRRMGGDLPKQFLEIGGKPILMHTLELFHSYDSTAQLVLTLPEEWKLFWEDLLLKHKCEIPHSIVDGGKERYFSIKNALDLCTGEFIAVHDGVRPFVSLKTIERCFLAVEELGQVVPVLPVKESLRFIQENESKSLDRTAYFAVQTPQCFKRSALIEAYKIPFHSGITDDASLVEEAGFFIHSVEGNEENIKVTTPLDIILADFLLKR